jgi:hypothetical protein
LLPGERYGVLLESSTLFTDSIQVDYFSLNTGEVWNTQYVDVDVDGFLNIETLDETSLKVYPNPTNGSLVVNLPSSGGTTKTVTVVNLIGELIMTQKFTGEEHTIDLINLQTGTYLLEILHDENKYVQKIIKR